jgi:hypothetical protein
MQARRSKSPSIGLSLSDDFMSLDDMTTQQRSKLDNALARISAPDVRWRLVDLFVAATEALNSGEYDYVILPARRMTCLYVLLRSVGLKPPKKGQILSDRYLEQSSKSNLLNGKRVALVDDVVVTGKTLKNKRDFLLAENVQISGELTIDVAVMDEGYQPSDELKLSEFNYPSVGRVVLPRNEVDSLACELAECLGTGLVPFFTDFPVSKETPTTSDVLSSLLSLEGWATINVTPSPLSFSGVRSLSLMPPEHEIDAFANDLGIKSGFQILKVRLFVRDDPFKPSFRLVPIVVPINNLAVTGDGWVGKDGAALYYISWRFGEFLRKQIAGLPDFEWDPTYEGLAAACLSELSPLNELTVTDKSIVLEPLTGNETGSDSSCNEIDSDSVRKILETLSRSRNSVLGDNVVEPFVMQFKKWFGENQTSDVKEKTLGAIANVFKITPSLASIAIDVLNDLGFAVSRPQGGTRVYRHGESFLALINDCPVGLLGGKYASRRETIVWNEDGSSTKILG